ncbi:hypothetical protein QTN24_15515 [Cupriavidus sp. SZY C1]|uniref:DUF6889 family protein n=1 Tax=Cupriavidus sp. SZY C1 TaxID=3055037 RepID=UPI0028B73E2F|nr:hypothetical protein [Cupriavidus sp. SZY C1]MDT6962908.1 hypothetical protein [Cupriavidus sp. SZY C1]
MAPVLEGLCKYESLVDGTLGLEDIALMNDALAVRADNQAAARRILEQQSNGPKHRNP